MNIDEITALLRPYRTEADQGPEGVLSTLGRLLKKSEGRLNRIRVLERCIARMKLERERDPEQVIHVKRKLHAAEKEIGALRIEAALHPNGRCGCHGEGRCQWCQLMETAEERDEARAKLVAIEEWTHVYGAALCPIRADTFGDGMRTAKAQIARILHAPAPIEPPAPPAAELPEDAVRLLRDIAELPGPVWNAGGRARAVLERYPLRRAGALPEPALPADVVAEVVRLARNLVDTTPGDWTVVVDGGLFNRLDKAIRRYASPAPAGEEEG